MTGYGQAEKDQVGVMIRALLRIEDEAMEEDAADALACALCHLNTRLFQKRLESEAVRDPLNGEAEVDDVPVADGIIPAFQAQRAVRLAVLHARPRRRNPHRPRLRPG